MSLDGAAQGRVPGNPSEHRKGVLLMLGAVLCWSTAGMLIRSMRLTDGWEITFWRSLFMSIVVLGWLLLRHGKSVWARIRAVGLPGVTVSALWALMYVSFILAVGRTTVANVLVLSSISPFAAAVFGGLFLHERVPGRTWFAMAFASGGIVLMFMESIAGGGLSGNLIALVIPITFACNIVLLRRMHASVDMVPTVLLSGLFSMAVTLPLAVPFEATPLDFGLLAIMGAVQLTLGLALMLAATPRLKAAELGLLAMLETVFGTLLTWLVVGEQPGRMALIGGLVVIAALAANELAALRSKPTATEEAAGSTPAGH